MFHQQANAAAVAAVQVFLPLQFFFLCNFSRPSWDVLIASSLACAALIMQFFCRLGD